MLIIIIVYDKILVTIFFEQCEYIFSVLNLKPYFFIKTVDVGITLLIIIHHLCEHNFF